MDSLLSRRRFLTAAGTLAGASALNTSLPAMAHAARIAGFPMIGPSDAERPQMPSGIQFGDVSEGRAIVWARSNGPALGRELEIARLLGAIKATRNVVWLTADVHYCAAQYYDPSSAQFSDFAGFWEFVAGPINAGSFGPNKLDQTFGPTAVFQKGPDAQGASPFAGFQFFGEVNIDPQSKALSVDLIDLNGVSQFRQTLAPQQG